MKILKIKLNENLSISKVDELTAPSGNFNTILVTYDIDDLVDQLTDLKLMGTFKRQDSYDSFNEELVSNTIGETTYSTSCYVPYDVLKTSGCINVGFYAYKLNSDNEVVARLSCTPLMMQISNGSFNENIGDTQTPDLTKYEEFVSKVEATKEEAISEFNTNATAKTTTYNDNATSKLEAYNTNATEKTTAFNDNATAKTEEFNTNASSYNTRISNLEVVTTLNSIEIDSSAEGNFFVISDETTNRSLKKYLEDYLKTGYLSPLMLRYSRQRNTFDNRIFMCAISKVETIEMEEDTEVILTLNVLNFTDKETEDYNDITFGVGRFGTLTIFGGYSGSGDSVVVNDTFTITDADIDYNGAYVIKTPDKVASTNYVDEKDSADNKLLNYSDRELGKEIIENKPSYYWNNVQKANFIFVIDDCNYNLPIFYNLFKTKNVPLSSATPSNVLETIYDNADGKTVKEILQSMVENGGEVLAHYSANLADEDYVGEDGVEYQRDWETWLKNTRDVKKTLEDNGFTVRGLIRADYTQSNSNTGEEICQTYFDYSDGVGKSLQYNLTRKFLMNFTTLDEIKSWVDTVVETNGVYPICFHGWESVCTTDNISSLVDYILSKSNANLTTYANVYDSYMAKDGLVFNSSLGTKIDEKVTSSISELKTNNIITKINAGYNIASYENEIMTTNEIPNYGLARCTLEPRFETNNGDIYYLSFDARLKSGTGNLQPCRLFDTWTSKNTATESVVSPTISSEYQRYCFKCTANTDDFYVDAIDFLAGATNGDMVLEITNIMISTDEDYSYSPLYNGETLSNLAYKIKLLEERIAQLESN